MIIVFRADAWRDYLAWQREDAKVLDRVNTLIAEAMRDPFRGTGKPEPLRATSPAGGRAGSQASTGWCTACAGRAAGRRWRCWLAGIIIEGVVLAW